MQVLLVLLAALVGAALAILTDRILKKRDAHNAEAAAINKLLYDLAAKRAFAMTLDVPWPKGNAERILGSVNHARTLIRETRVLLQPRSRFLDPLRAMTLACNTFIEQAEYRPSEVPTPEDVQLLSAQVKHEAERLRSIRPRRIVAALPGSLALSPNVDYGRVTLATPGSPSV